MHAPAIAADHPDIHPMHPSRGENLTPQFAAFLCWLLQLPPMTTPAITAICVTSGCLIAATTEDPFFNTHLNSIDEFERNLRAWGQVCDADHDIIESLVARIQGASQ